MNPDPGRTGRVSAAFDPSTAAPQSAPPRRARLRGRVGAVVGLTVVWILLWGDISWGNLFGGVLVSLVLVTAFPLPALDLRGRVRPVAFTRFALSFFWSLMVASVNVTVVAVRPRPVHNAVIAVPLRIATDFNVALTAVVVTLLPGSVVMEARRETGTLYIHLLGVRDRSDVERLRHEILEVESRLVRAFGSADEIEELNRRGQP